MFNFLGFDPKATNLYLVVASPAQHDAVSRPLGQVTAAVGAQGLAARYGQIHEGADGLLRRSHVPKTHPWADDVHLAYDLFIHRLQVVIEDQHLAVGNGLANVAVTVIGLQRPMGDQHRGLRWAIEIMKLTLPRQPFDHMGLADLTPCQQVCQPQRLIERQGAQQRGGQKGVSDALPTQQFQ